MQDPNKGHLFRSSALANPTPISVETKVGRMERGKETESWASGVTMLGEGREIVARLAG